MTKTELESHAFWDRAINLETGEILDEGDEGADSPDVYSIAFLLRIHAFVETLIEDDCPS